MRRLIVLATLAGALALPAPVAAFHHGGLPSTFCSAEAAGSPSDENGRAKESIREHNPQGLPLPPVGTPGQGQGAEARQHCQTHR